MGNQRSSNRSKGDIVDDDILWCTWGCSSWMWTGIRGDVRNPLSDVRILFWEERIRFPRDIILLDVTPNSGSHPTTAPPSASQDVIVDYIYYKINISMNSIILKLKMAYNNKSKTLNHYVFFCFWNTWSKW